MEIGFIGTGQMAQALAAGFVSDAGGKISFLIHDPSEPSRDAFSSRVGGDVELVVCEGNQEVVNRASIVFLAVKPQIMEMALAEVQINGEGPLLVSIAAGITIGHLQQLTGSKRIIRVMPNTPCLIGKGASGLAASDGISEDDIASVSRLIQSVSLVEVVQEDKMDVVTGLSGSGPAYVFTFIEALCEGAVANGLEMESAKRLAVQTVIGAAELVSQSEDSIDVLRKRVTSPGGTTLAGLESLASSGFNEVVANAVTAATERSIELGNQD
ncbi:MAG: pyrroline-5-carboxylate reductase [Planctomycetota bacterium]